MFLEHVNMTVSDLDRSVDFYERLFGFRVRWRGPVGDGQGEGAHVGDDRSYLALFEERQPDARVHDYGRTGFNHFGFVVADLDEVRERLRSLDTEWIDLTYDPGQRLYFSDPDGIEVEVVAYAD